MNLFWVDETRNLVKSYSDLIDDINSLTTFRHYVYEQNPYLIFLRIIQGLVLGKELELIDSDMSESELSHLGVEAENVSVQTPVQRLSIRSTVHLLEEIKTNAEDFRLSLYTSGTTGKPKKIQHSLKNLTRFVKVVERFQTDVWAFAYNPTHMAGLQVFFQALLNLNTMVYVFKFDQNNIGISMSNYKVTQISATPTYYRMMLPVLHRPIASVRGVTMGGEKYDNQLKVRIESVFPNARIRNIYASTEAGSLLNGCGEYFSISEGHERYISVDNDGELLIHKVLMGESAECVIDGDWYHTGDLVSFIDKFNFKFVARKTEMINVGGYKVNPHEIEAEIKNIHGVIDVVIRARANSITGNLIVADVIKNDTISAEDLERTICTELAKRLQRWKLPQIIKFVNELEHTKSGKKVRL